MKLSFFIFTFVSLANLSYASEFIAVKGWAKGECRDSDSKLLIQARLDAIRNAGPYFVQVGRWKENVQEYGWYGECRTGKQAIVESTFKRR